MQLQPSGPHRAALLSVIQARVRMTSLLSPDLQMNSYLWLMQPASSRAAPSILVSSLLLALFMSCEQGGSCGMHASEGSQSRIVPQAHPHTAALEHQMELHITIK